ncbi:MAG: UvrB/UvrC motif-containing protein [Gaiellaceae bacterium]
MLSGPGRRVTSTYEPKAPPLAAEFIDEIERVRAEKDEAIAAHEFERAASLRDRERKLADSGRALERAWEGQSIELERGYAPIAGSRPLSVTRDRDMFSPAFFLGWLSFAAALGIGVLVGWLIWG